MFSRKTDAQLSAELKSVEAALENLLVNSEPIKTAANRIEELRDKNYTEEQIEQELAKSALPDIRTVGKTTAQELTKLWWLNYKKRKLENKLAKI